MWVVVGAVSPSQPADGDTSSCVASDDANDCHEESGMRSQGAMIGRRARQCAVGGHGFIIVPQAE